MRQTFLGVLVLTMALSLVLVKTTRAVELPTVGFGFYQPTLISISHDQINASLQLANEARRLQAEQKTLANMKRQVIPKLERTANLLRAQQKNLNKRGMPTLQGVDEDLALLDEYIAKLKAATTIEELEKFFDAFPTLIDKVKKQLESMAKGVDLLNVLKQAEGLIAKLEAQSKALKAKAVKLGMEKEMAEFLIGLDIVIADQKIRLAQLIARVKADPDNAVTAVGEYFDYLRKIFDVNAGSIGYGLDLRNAIKTKLPQLISAMEKKLAAVKKDQKFLDRLPELLAIISEAKIKYEELKALVAAEPLDISAIIRVLEELADLNIKFFDKLEEITGQNTNPYRPRVLTEIFANKKYPLPLPPINVTRDYVIYP